MRVRHHELCVESMLVTLARVHSQTLNLTQVSPPVDSILQNSMISSPGYMCSVAKAHHALVVICNDIGWHLLFVPLACDALSDICGACVQP